MLIHKDFQTRSVISIMSILGDDVVVVFRLAINYVRELSIAKGFCASSDANQVSPSKPKGVCECLLFFFLCVLKI